MGIGDEQRMSDMKQTNMQEAQRNSKRHHVRFSLSIRKTKLMLYDLCMLALASISILLLYPDSFALLTVMEKVVQLGIAAVCIIGVRSIFHIYSQVWRYSRINSYLRLMCADIVGGALYIIVALILPMDNPKILCMIMLVLINLLGSLTIRFLYTWLFEISTSSTRLHRFFGDLSPLACWIDAAVYRITGISFIHEASEKVLPAQNRIRIAIIGAGRIGAMLAEELLNNPNAVYTPVCFIDVDREKIGRQVMGIEVLPAREGNQEQLNRLAVQEVVFAVNKTPEERAALFDRYKGMGFKVKVYTFPVENTEANGKRQIREFDVEELLFRREVDFLGEETRTYYKDKVVLVSGGGGSIGSELSRQIARMGPRQLILLDIYENNLYDIQQEMRLTYGNALNLAVEVASVRDAEQLDKVFRQYRPQIVLHAAAHKHVPLMEHNCSEAVKNNVFGTWNIVNAAEKYGVEKFIMISTDKAVNPTNVMGASKRMCEMIVLSRAREQSRTSFSCTRFGNVLGSNGSVIPLFKRQIANGGPVTVTDKRIIRYFMTIPEASQLVLTSGAMAKSGELFVLDMGRPVKILDLAENMIRLSGLEPYKDIDIVETGLRPGEKLYEELLIKTEELDKTGNDMIFIERDTPPTHKEIEEKLAVLKSALATEDDDVIRRAMKRVVPTYHSPKHVNEAAIASGRYAEEADGQGSQMAVG